MENIPATPNPPQTDIPFQPQPQPQKDGLSEDSKTIITILLLIFAYPIGLILTYVWTKWPKWLKILLTVPLVLAIIGIFFAVLVGFTTYKAIKNPETAKKIGEKIVESNPKLAERSRDAQRQLDLAQINQALVIASQVSAAPLKLCGKTKAPCIETSDKNPSKLLDGSGWIKVDLLNIDNIALKMSLKELPELPLDPTNSEKFHYSYCSDGKNWEINAKLESEEGQDKALADGGDDAGLYEVGSGLALCK